MALNWGWFFLPGDIDNIPKQFWLSPWGEGMLLASSGWKTEMVETSYNMQDNSLGQIVIWPRISIQSKAERHALEKSGLRNARVMYMLVKKIIRCRSFHFCLFSKIIKRKWLCFCSLCLFCTCHHGGLSWWMVYLTVLISWAGSLSVVL